MRLYKWIKEGDLISAVKNDPIENKEDLISSFTREVRIRNIKLDTSAIFSWANGVVSDLLVGEKEKIDIEPKIEITYNKKMNKAYVTTYPNIVTGELPKAEAIRAELSKQGISHGVIEVTLIKYRDGSVPLIDEVIAETKDAVNGNDAELVQKFENKGPVKPKLLEDGRADFYNTSVIENVTKGQILVEKIPPTVGIPGITVKGKVLPALNGKNIKLPIGKNIDHSSDGLKAIASIDGMLSTARNRLSVLPVFEVNGDVDFETGNIEFLGNVIVKGNLKNDFSINSGGDVHIYGIVEGGHITAEGSIFIKTGIRGMKKSLITAKGSINSKFIENATIKANLDVIVDNVIMHSEVTAGNGIILSKDKALLVGGSYRAAHFIKCKNIGNNLATKTELEVGVDPSLKDEFLAVSKEYNIIKDNIKKTRQAIVILEEAKNKLGSLPPAKIQMYQGLLVSLKKSTEKEEELRQDVVDFSEKISELRDAFIEVEENVNPGTNIVIGEYSKKVVSPNYKVKIYLSHGDIIFSPLV